MFAMEAKSFDQTGVIFLVIVIKPEIVSHQVEASCRYNYFVREGQKKLNRPDRG